MPTADETKEEKKEKIKIVKGSEISILEKILMMKKMKKREHKCFCTNEKKKIGHKKLHHLFEKEKKECPNHHTESKQSRL